jgi:hypothetical protein
VAAQQLCHQPCPAKSNRISTRVAIRPEDEVYFGSFKIKVARLLSERGAIVGEAVCESVGFQGGSIMLGRDPQCDRPPTAH